MTFWGSEKLREKLSDLVDPADPECIDCAAYMLKVGPEYYVTPTDERADPKSFSIQRLVEGESFAIPPGQFAWVLTEETIKIPSDTLALLSIRARIKLRGLVNISGFHADPGFHGRFTFAVLNAGPLPIHLRRGDPTFLIWFASLDAPKEVYTKTRGKSIDRIDTAAVNQVAGEVLSLPQLQKRITALEQTHRFLIAAGSVVVTAAIAFGVGIVLRGGAPNTSPEANSTMQTQASSAAASQAAGSPTIPSGPAAAARSSAAQDSSRGPH
jgi:dCTP deaminase